MYAVVGVIRHLHIAGVASTQQNERSILPDLALHAADLAERNAMRDADDDHAMWHFGFVLNDKAVAGSLPVTGFKEGDKVTAIVMDDAGEGTLHAHAIVRQEDGLVSLPYSAAKGRYARLLKMIRIALLSIFGGALCLSPLFYSDPVRGGFVGTLAGYGSVCGMLALLVVTFMYFSGAEREYPEQIMRLLGFKRPKIVNLTPFSAFALDPAKLGVPGSRYAYYLVPALKHYRSLPAGHPASKT